MGARFNDLDLLVLKVEVELEVEIRREQERDTCMSCESSWVPLNVEHGSPSDLLSVIWLNEFLRILEVAHHIDTLALTVYIFSFIHCRSLIIDDLEHAVGVLAEIEPLCKLRMQIPGECLQPLV